MISLLYLVSVPPLESGSRWAGIPSMQAGNKDLLMTEYYNERDAFHILNQKG